MLHVSVCFYEFLSPAVSLHVFVCFSVCVPINDCLSVCFCLSAWISLGFSFSLSLSQYLCLSGYLFLYVYVSICFNLSLSACLPVCLSHYVRPLISDTSSPAPCLLVTQQKCSVIDSRLALLIGQIGAPVRPVTLSLSYCVRRNIPVAVSNR